MNSPAKRPSPWALRLKPGITRGALLGIILLLTFTLLVGGGNLWATHAYVQEFRSQMQQQQDEQQSLQKKAGQIIEGKICSSFEKLAALKPPAGNIQDNPSRAYEQRQHDILAQVPGDIECPVHPLY